MNKLATDTFVSFALRLKQPTTDSSCAAANIFNMRNNNNTNNYNNVNNNNNNNNSSNNNEQFICAYQRQATNTTHLRPKKIHDTKMHEARSCGTTTTTIVTFTVAVSVVSRVPNELGNARVCRTQREISI